MIFGEIWIVGCELRESGKILPCYDCGVHGTVVLAPATMLGRGFLSGWDLFEQVLLAISWYAIIETARNSVITSLIDQKTPKK